MAKKKGVGCHGETIVNKGSPDMIPFGRRTCPEEFEGGQAQTDILGLL